MDPQCFALLSRCFLPFSRPFPFLPDDAPKPVLPAWDEALDHFQESWRICFRLMGWVPEQECRMLETEIRKLRRKLHDREQTIERLRLALDAGGLSLDRPLQVWQDLARRQGEAFQNLVAGLFAS